MTADGVAVGDALDLTEDQKLVLVCTVKGSNPAANIQVKVGEQDLTSSFTQRARKVLTPVLKGGKPGLAKVRSIYTHAHIHTYTHTCTHMQTHTHAHPHTHTHTRTHTEGTQGAHSRAEGRQARPGQGEVYIHTRAHTYIHTHTHTPTHADTNTRTHTQKARKVLTPVLKGGKPGLAKVRSIYTHTHTYIHTHAHRHTHTHTPEL